MSDPKRATLITVRDSKSEKVKTVRLTINLDESNESKYPELNYKELVKAEVRKKKDKVQNGKTGLNPFSDNDDDVERVAKKFEQKYGGKSTYGRKGRSKHDDFADIGAGYDENDSFIDNTDGYDEMIPPEIEPFYGGFYINCGSLEFKNVPENQLASSDGEPGAGRRNKRRISSSSSEESSESSSESSRDVKEAPVANGAMASHKTDHRKKKTKIIDKNKAKKIRRADSSAATSGKQTSDDNNHGDGESDSRTSQSDSLTSKPAPSSENAITSDSSRDVEAKLEPKMPAAVCLVLEELEAVVNRQLADNPNTPTKELETRAEPYVIRLERALSACREARAGRPAWTRAARVLRVPRTKLLQRVRALVAEHPANTTAVPTSVITQPATNNIKRKMDDSLEPVDVKALSEKEREAKIVETLQRLKSLIDERKPGMMANYNAECERVQEERKKIQIASAADGVPHIEKRLPKRRFPWCPRSRALLARLKTLAGDENSAAALLAKRALPLFPNGFVRMPTLLRQADLSKEIKVADVKRQRLGSSTLPTTSPQQIQFPEPIQFPSSLTVTTMKSDKTEISVVPDDKDKFKKSSIFGSIINTFHLSKDLVLEMDERNKESTVTETSKEDMYIPPNNIGSITITPVPSNQVKTDKKLFSTTEITPVLNNQAKQDKKVNNTDVSKHKEGLIRVKSPAALNEMVNKKEKVADSKKDKDKHKKTEKSQPAKEKRIDLPLHIDTTYQPSKNEPTPSPKKKEEISQKIIANMRVAENNIPRPTLVPVHHSPTFAKPDKRPPEIKKKKDLVIVSDVDPLSDAQQEPVAIDDSSSDVEVIEDSKSDKRSDQCESVPSKDNVQKDSSMKDGEKNSEKKVEKLDEATKQDFASVMKNLRDLEHSQEPKFTSNSYGGVITSAQNELL